MTKYLLVGLFILLQNSVFAQKFKHFDEVTHINCMAVDFNDNKWFGLEDGLGCLKADDTFQVYKRPGTTDSLFQQITSIAVDDKGVVWIASIYNGQSLMRIDSNAQVLNRYEIPSFQNKDLYINDIAIDKNQNAWIATAEGGIWMINTAGKWFCYDVNTTKYQLPTNEINDILVDEYNTKWIATNEGLFSTVDGTKFLMYDLMNPILFLVNSDGNVCASAIDSKGKQFMACNRATRDKELHSKSKHSSKTSKFHFNNIVIDNQGIIWGSGNGVARYERKEEAKEEHWEIFDQSNSNLKTDETSCLAVDQKDRLWIGTKNAGLYMLELATEEELKEIAVLETQAAEEAKKIIEEEVKTVAVATKEKVKVGGEEVEVGQKVEITELEFEPNSTMIRISSTRMLDELYKTLSSNKKLKLRIAGHNSEGAKYILSLKRAESVKNYLVEKGIDPKRIEAIGFGSQQLKDPENPKSQVNRRVEFTFHE